MVAIIWQPSGCYLVEAVVGFPDRIERTVQATHQPGRVRAALTAAGGPGAWSGNSIQRASSLASATPSPPPERGSWPASGGSSPRPRRPPVSRSAAVTGGVPAATAGALAATLGLAAASWVVAVQQMTGMDMGVATRLG